MRDQLLLLLLTSMLAWCAAPVASASDNAATFAGTDIVTQGDWRMSGIYGGDGYRTFGDATNDPGYANVSLAGAASYTWNASTTAGQAPQKAASADRIAACMYGSQFTIDIACDMPGSHTVSVYGLDWDFAGRSETIEVLDGDTLAVLDTESLSDFSGGKYLSWTITGHVTLVVSQVAGPNAVLSGLFFGTATPASGGTASFIAADAATQGDWKESGYGTEGALTMGDATSVPSYLTSTFAIAGALNFTWAAPTSAGQALEDASSGSRTAASIYEDSFAIDLPCTDSASHQIAVYLLDWDALGRSERIDVLDGATGAVLNTRTVSGFQGGVYLQWSITGHVKIRATNLGGLNAVISGIFFGKSTPAPAGTATYVTTDQSTSGNWIGVYGAQGYQTMGDALSNPSYATIVLAGAQENTWASPTSDGRALQQAATPTSRTAAAAYAASQLVIDLACTDANQHQVAIYGLDWDGLGRSERLDVIDGATGALLDTRELDSFSGGAYLVWTVAGHVKLRFTSLSGPNAVVSGIFFDAGTVGGGTGGTGGGGGGNPMPSFSVGPDVGVFGPYGAETYSGWITNIQPGAPGETVSFTVSVDQPNAFTVLPAIDASGNLTFTPEATPPGYQTTMTITARDSNDAGTSTQTAPLTIINASKAFTIGGSTGFLIGPDDPAPIIQDLNGPYSWTGGGGSVNGGAVTVPCPNGGTFSFLLNLAAWDWAMDYPWVGGSNDSAPAAQTFDTTIPPYTATFAVGGALLPPYEECGLRLPWPVAPTGQPKSGGNLDSAGVQQDGAVTVTGDDLKSQGLTGWVQARSFSSVQVATDVHAGNNWQENGRPQLLQVPVQQAIDGPPTDISAAIQVVLGQGNTVSFNSISGIYTPAFGNSGSLVDNPATGEFTFTDMQGGQMVFTDFSNNLSLGGQFIQASDPAGNLTTTAYNADGTLATVTQTAPSGSSNTFSYTYVSIGTYAPMIQSVALTETVNSVTTPVRTVRYAYYTGAPTDFGNLGDLQSSTIVDGATANVVDVAYYRYYLPGDIHGYQGGLQFKMTTANYNRMVGDGLNPLTATAAQLLPYTDAYYEYNGMQQVTKAVIAGAGCSCVGSTGAGTYIYKYKYSSWGLSALYGYNFLNGQMPLDSNSWALKTTTTLLDMSGHLIDTTVVYSNTTFQPLLTIFTGDGVTTSTVQQYDDMNRLVLTAKPTAVAGYDDTQADLGIQLYTAAGLITGTDYAQATTATDTQPGDAEGFEQDTWVAQGSSGAHILQTGMSYYTHSDGNGNTIFPVASETRYRSDDPANPLPETTQHAYTWMGQTNQMQSQQTTYPMIPTSENGSGIADTETDVFDVYGRVQWHQDGDGFITYHAYDDSTGAVVETIVDVDMTHAGSLPSNPGWTTPTGGGLNLVTNYLVDSQGRTTEQQDPDGTLTETVFDDPDHEVRTYPGWNPTTGTTTGPIQVSRDDEISRYHEDLTMAAVAATTGSAGHLRPTGGETISQLQTLSRSYLDAGGRTTAKDDYISFTGMIYSAQPSIGAIGVNYLESTFAFDEQGRQVRVQNAVGTITHTIYDTRSRMVATWIGTNDTPPTSYWSPTNNVAPANMVQVASQLWDNGGPGDDTLTLETSMPTGLPTDNRVVQHWYDWRDRQVATKSGVDLQGNSSEDTSTHRPLQVCLLDNLGACVLAQMYDSDQWSPSIVAGVLSGLQAGQLRAQTATAFDERGRAYQTTIFAVDQANGSSSETGLVTSSYFNHRGQSMAVIAPGGLVRTSVIDGAGRQIVQSTSDGAGGTSWTAMATTANDHVLVQTLTAYDGNGNAILTTSKERIHTETGTGDLGSPNVAPLARDSYQIAYYDAANRMIAHADLGTNGGAAYTVADRPASPPSSTDTVLVTSQTYATAGWIQTQTDPRGITTYMAYDALGRQMERIEAWDGTASPEPSANANRITLTSYDGLGHVTLLTAENVDQATNQVTLQETGYTYGVSAPSSVVSSNDLLAVMAFPDPATGLPSTQAINQQQYSYLATGQLATMTDGDGSVHAHLYDVLGRQLSDQVMTVGAAVDGSIRRMDTAYDTGGRPYGFTSYADLAGTTVVSQIGRIFNGLGQLMQEWQSPSGAISGATPSVQYAYSYLAGGVNNSRLTTITYPNGRTLQAIYTSGLDDAISRVSALADSAGSSSGVQDEVYSYCGLSRITQRSQVEPGITATIVQQPGDAIGDGGDLYVGLDRFGRLIDSRWIATGTGQPSNRVHYAYDRASEKLSANNLVNPAFSVLYHANGAGEATAYDSFGRMTATTRGTLSASGSNGATLDTVATPTDPTSGANPVYGSQEWNLDQLGNWSSVTSDGTADTRTHNLQNELTLDSAGALGYDNNGNLTAQAGQTANTYDAWNRATSIRGVTYTYDALGRRIWESANGGRAFFYDGQRMIETRLGAANALASAAHEQYVYGQGYVDDVVLRDRAADNSGGDLGIAGSGLNERLYYQQDREFNVVALLSQAGAVMERYAYDPYGSVSALNPDWSLLSGGSAYANQVGFTGRWLDETGMWYFRARYLEPVLGRFISRDPMGYKNGHDLYCAYFVPGKDDPKGTSDFVVGARPLDVLDKDSAEKFIADLVGVNHVDIFYKGEVIHVGYGGNTAKGAMDLGGRTIIALRRIFDPDLELQYGHYKGLPCSCAGDLAVKDAIENTPSPTTEYNWLTNSCQTDVEDVVRESCLRGYESTVSQDIDNLLPDFLP